MSVSKICEPLCQCIGDHFQVSKRTLHITAGIIWACGILAVNMKLVIYMATVSQGKSSKYDLVCLPDSNNNNRTWIPFAIGAIIGLMQVPWIFKFVRRNYTRIHQLPPNGGYLISQNRSCYRCYFLTFLTCMIMIFVAMDEVLCGKDNYTENRVGAKCVFIGLDACVGLFLLFGFLGFIVSYFKGPLEDDVDYTQLIKENDASTTESNEPMEDEPNTII
mmetsp:Transcript_74058/g.66643  ORF Transcript_74058/g.66643 Transcript_74058/m.66643 type:complete len:219 (+) Transcript_74058:64-720(+)